MEGIQKAFRTLYEDSKIGSSSSSSSPLFDKPSFTSGVNTSSTDTSRVLMTRPPRNVVSLWSCSKLCAIFFVAGVIVGYTLKRRVKRWASKLLKRLKDD